MKESLRFSENLLEFSQYSTSEFFQRCYIGWDSVNFHWISETLSDSNLDCTVWCVWAIRWPCSARRLELDANITCANMKERCQWLACYVMPAKRTGTPPPLFELVLRFHKKEEKNVALKRARPWRSQASEATALSGPFVLLRLSAPSANSYIALLVFVRTT